MAVTAPLILVTGATGFVGRQVLRVLAEHGARLHLVVREGRPAATEYPTGVERIITTPDLFAETEQWWGNVCKGIDIVIHVAWYVEPGEYLQSTKNTDCLNGTLRLAKGATRSGVRRFVGIGTCFEYDLSLGTLSTDSPLLPLTPYAEAKAMAFKELSLWLPQHGVEFAWCRLFYLFGEGEDRRRLVPHLHAKLSAGEPVDLTSGNQIRDFIDVREAGRMIADIALGQVQGAVNICSGIPITIRQLAESVAREYGRTDLLRFGARPENLVDPPCVVRIRDKYLD